MDGVLLGLGLVVIIAYLWYVSLVKKRNAGREALSGIDVQLKKRANVVPNILTIAKKFMDHEKSLLTEITELRTQVTNSYDTGDADEINARRFYNAAVTELNNAVEIFPGSIIASMANIKVMPFYEADEAAKAPVNAGDYLN
jgi:LemA protein